MAVAAQVASSVLLSPDGSLPAAYEEEWMTPSVWAILAVIFVIMGCMIGGIWEYWHKLEEAKALHPDSIGYGKWYFSLIPRIWLTVVSSLWILMMVIVAIIIVVIPGPRLAQAYEKYKFERQEDKLINSEEMSVISQLKQT